jgi:hypothetical protein
VRISKTPRPCRSTTADLAELWLALRALGHLSVEQPAS